MASVPIASPVVESRTVMISGTMTLGFSSIQPMLNSFWKSSFILWPLSASSPSSSTLPRRNPSVVLRLTSTIFPSNRIRPSSQSTTAWTGFCFDWRASCTARPMPIAWETVRSMPHSFTSRPVRGALHVAAVEPTSVQIFRLTRSIHFQVGTLDTTVSTPLGSAKVRG